MEGLNGLLACQDYSLPSWLVEVTANALFLDFERPEEKGREESPELPESPPLFALRYAKVDSLKRELVMVLLLDLQDFLLRARVLKLYRQALRVAGRAPEHARAELRQTVRQEMENNRNCNDKQRIRFLISEGLARLKGLDEMLDMQGH
ncbi:hypothetical protein CK203_005580 [Vitis vinifera]|uniref:LYR motif-containing protein 2 n=1 Tax=Vitis vinifera TaxID=29760 RepID=A0A438K4B7_VITVI|nr:hypothetical protein CK203_005580 [Vitis vinifera]